jgi:hypothetical protein
MQKLTAELKSLDDADRRMSIWPLIEAGEFSTISEGLTQDDKALLSGKWADRMQEIMDRIPAQLGTAGRYFWITRDTALFKGMSRAVQYGDFLAKAVLYDQLTGKEGLSSKAALDRLTEEFVNYNLLPGRTRSYAEAMGLTWFWAYKLRSMKVALNHIRRNPLRALLLNAGSPVLPDMPGITVGSPLTDNMAAVTADGRLGYSVGIGMLFNAPDSIHFLARLGLSHSRHKRIVALETRVLRHAAFFAGKVTCESGSVRRDTSCAFCVSRTARASCREGSQPRAWSKVGCLNRPHDAVHYCNGKRASRKSDCPRCSWRGLCIRERCPRHVIQDAGHTVQ